MKTEIEKILASSASENKSSQKSSELRQDIVTGDWVVIATGRAKRPDEFGNYQRLQDDISESECIFCDPVASGQEKDVLMYENSEGDWTLRVFPNKYPAFSQGRSFTPKEEGPYFSMPGVGYHEIIVTRDHSLQIAEMYPIQISEIFDAYQERYLDLMNKKSVNYISIFHNHGKEVGGSVAHPHSQLIAIPVISPYIKSELDGAEEYYRSNRECVYCAMAEFEGKEKKRIVFENDDFIAFCPFASRAAFEVWVMPKKHKPYFERTTPEEKVELGKVFQKAMSAIFKALKDPPYNFYIHTSPCDGKDYEHYHWHVEILPHTATWAGFELETGIEISTIQPEAAAEYLREQLN